MKNIGLLAVLSFLTVSAFSKSNHAAFDVLLKKYVSNTGIVNYKGFKADETHR